MAKPLQVDPVSRRRSGDSPVKLAGVILAAGLSSRMGRSKPLLEFEGETFLDRAIALLSPVCDPVITVLGHEAEAVRNAIRRTAQTTFVSNPEYRLGQLSSLQTGIRSLPGGCTHALFTPVDLPQIQVGTVHAIAFACHSYRDRIVRPRYGSRRGHPAALPSRLFPDLLALDPTAKTNEFLQAYSSITEFIDVDDPYILNDVDLPSEYQALLTGRTP